jgi:hypothetical protein
MIRTLDERPNIFIRDKPISSSEGMLHKDYDHRGSVPPPPPQNKTGREAQGAWHQELIGGNPLVVK